jgi:predicted nucleotidyltransferase
MGIRQSERSSSLERSSIICMGVGMRALPREINEVLKEFVREVSALPGLLSVILYGSVARGDYDARSDVDLLLIFEDEISRESAERKVSEAVVRLGHRLEPQCYSLEGLKRADKSFLREVFRDSVQLYGTIKIPSALTLLGLQPTRLVKIWIDELSSIEKVKFSQALYGRTSRVGKKSYTYRGLLHGLGGRQLGRGVIEVPENAWAELKSFLDGWKVKYKSEKIWRS